jgi:hypothetical protein
MSFDFESLGIIPPIACDKCGQPAPLIYRAPDVPNSENELRIFQCAGGHQSTRSFLRRKNGIAERLIGSIRRECIDHVIIFGEAHLRRILRSYARYYNDVRTHRSLNKEAPVSRPVQRIGSIMPHPILGGLHHHYVRI